MHTHFDQIYSLLHLLQYITYLITTTFSFQLQVLLLNKVKDLLGVDYVCMWLSIETYVALLVPHLWR